jgi:NADPH:quinone reductase-like Zn-dependent oxidoreductase
MKVAWFETFGKPAETLKIGEKPTPEPGPGEVRVRLITSGVNPSDVKKRAGAFPHLLDDGYVIPHSDGAGVIDAVGKGVDASRVGERVWVYQAQHKRRFGTAAEYVVVEERRAPTLPDRVSFEAGAVYGIPVMTAHRCVFAEGDPAGKIILVTGGAGRVGLYAIQWASRAGATVVATASNSADEAVCRKAGAAHIVNHREAGWGTHVLAATGGQKVDQVVEVEFGANLPEVLDCIRIGGAICTYSSSQDMTPTLPFYRMMFMDLTVRMVIVYEMPEAAKQQAIADIARHEADGGLTHRIAEVYALSDCADAQAAIEAGDRRGAVVLRIQEA